MRYGVFAMTAVRKTGHDFAVGQVAPDMSGDRSGFVFQVTPNKRLHTSGPEVLLKKL